MPTAPRLVIFDMDDVLFHLDRPRRLATLAALTGLAPERVDAAIWRSGFDDECDRGLHSADECHRGACARLGVALSMEAWVGARVTAMTPAHAVWELAVQAKRRAALALLSNNNQLFRRELPRHFPQITDLFGEHVYFSAQLGLSKPDPAAFREVTRRVGHLPEETLLIDDGADYVQGARAAGLQTHHFTTARALEADLRARGLV